MEFSRPPLLSQKIPSPRTFFQIFFWHPNYADSSHVHHKLVLYDRQATHILPQRDTVTANKMYKRGIFLKYHDILPAGGENFSEFICINHESSTPQAKNFEKHRVIWEIKFKNVIWENIGWESARPPLFWKPPLFGLAPPFKQNFPAPVPLVHPNFGQPPPLLKGGDRNYDNELS